MAYKTNSFSSKSNLINYNKVVERQKEWAFGNDWFTILDK